MGQKTGGGWVSFFPVIAQRGIMRDESVDFGSICEKIGINSHYNIYWTVQIPGLKHIGGVKGKRGLG